ncbi:MAG TPA: TonB-dependent receptor [Rhizomicrobium sp.]|nr:TonB-dependent receptor [Rhizomicrobium sp.]
MRLGLAAAALCFALASARAFAQQQVAELVIVTAASQGGTRSVAPDSAARPGTLTVAQALSENLPSAFLSDTESNLLQPDLYYRGFDASPVLGTAQGLAVYQDGDRINQPFGDTVLWDTVPLFAVSRIDVLPGSDPVLGLNALGGAVSLAMKTGFDWQGSEIGVSGGSFGRARAEGEFGRDWGDEALYVGAMLLHDDGWRLLSPSNAAQAYADYSAKGAWGSAGLSISLASDKLSENAAVPVEDSRRAAFAIPDIAKDQTALVQAHADSELGGGFTVRGQIFASVTHIETLNGQASGFEACASPANLLCDDNGPLATLAGAPVPANLVGDGSFGVQTTNTQEIGATAEASWKGELFGLRDDAVFGVTFDDAPSTFDSSTTLGTLHIEGGSAIVQSDGILLGGDDRNVRLKAVDRDFGVYAKDTLDLTDTLSLSLAGRWDLDRIDLTDRFGTALTGNHAWSRFNPSAELDWQPLAAARLHALVGQSSRTPTAAELSCADAQSPCLFPLSFISDPDLKEVVARTLDIGANGSIAEGELTLSWLADLYDTRNDNDILFISAGPTIGSGYFANVGATDRRGAELGLKARWQEFDAGVNYGFVDATFRAPFAEQSAFNPGADANGIIFVPRGARLPNIPRHTANVTLGWQATQRLHLGLKMIAASGQYLRGDEANLNAPLPGYTVFDADVSYRVTSAITLTLEGENIFDRRYASFGLYGDPTGGGTFPQFSNPRFIIPAQPFGIWGGVKVAW